MLTALIARFGITNLIGGALLALVTGYVGYLYVHEKSLEADLAKSSATITILRADIKAEQAANALQAAAVIVMKTETASLKDRVAASVIASAAAARLSATEISRIRNAPVPKDCQGAVEWMKSEAVGISNSWNSKQ